MKRNCATPSEKLAALERVVERLTAGDSIATLVVDKDFWKSLRVATRWGKPASLRNLTAQVSALSDAANSDKARQTLLDLRNQMASKPLANSFRGGRQRHNRRYREADSRYEPF